MPYVINRRVPVVTGNIQNAAVGHWPSLGRFLAVHGVNSRDDTECEMLIGLTPETLDALRAAGVEEKPDWVHTGLVAIEGVSQ
jgi:hypothetical protein